VNGFPVELVKPEILRTKVLEPVILLGEDRFTNLDIRVRVKNGGQVAQLYSKDLRLFT